MKKFSTFLKESSNKFESVINVIENGKVIDTVKGHYYVFSADDFSQLQSIEKTILDNKLYLGKHQHITFEETLVDTDGNVVHSHKYTPTIRNVVDYDYVVYTSYCVEYTDEDGNKQHYDADDYCGYYDELSAAKEAIKEIKYNETYKNVHLVYHCEAYSIGKLTATDYEVSDSFAEVAEGETETEALRSIKKLLSPSKFIKEKDLLS